MMDADDDTRNEASTSSPAVRGLSPAVGASPAPPSNASPAPPSNASPAAPPQQQYLGDGTPIPINMSKSAFKRQLKKESWEASKGDRRAKEKEKKKEKRAAAQERKLEEAKEADGVPTEPQPPRKKRRAFKAKVVIDMGFDELMTDKEVTSMTSQLAFLYSSNHRSHAPFFQVILAGPSRTSALSYSPDPSTIKQLWAPHDTARADGYYPRLEEAIKDGDTIEINESRIGKLMQANGEAQWRRWKNVAIVEKGGLEALWEGGAATEKGESQETAANGKEASNGDKAADLVTETAAEPISETAAEPISETAAELISETAAEDQEAVQATQDDPSAESKRSSRRRSRKRGASFVHPSSIVPTDLKKEDIVYLTADTDEAIEELEEGKTYVIGGIVDRNRYKHLCLNKAKSLELKVARLPIDISNLTKKSAEGKMLQSRKVLTVNQVFDILIGWTEQYQQEAEEGDAGQEGWRKPSWEEALDRGLPGRKFVKREDTQDKDGQGAPDDADGASVHAGEGEEEPASKRLKTAE